MQMNHLLKATAAVALISVLSGCSWFGYKKESTPSAESRFLPEYVAITPVTLPPLAADMKVGLHDIAEGIVGGTKASYDLDLLVLPTAVSKAQYDFINVNGSGSAGVFSGSGSTERNKTIYDLMQMASNPLPVVLPPPPGARSGETIIVTPFIGVGVRIIAEYTLSSGKTKLSLPALAAEIDAKGGAGSIEIQQIGISRYGSNGQGITGIELTPDNLDFAMKGIGLLMGQLWLKDTRVQPMIVGYSVLGYSGIDAKYHPYIVQQIISRKEEIMQPFVQSMFHEAKYELNIMGSLRAKNVADKTNYNEKLKELQSQLDKQKVKAETIAEVALVAPNKLSNVTDSLLEKHIPDESANAVEVKRLILQEIGGAEAR